MPSPKINILPCVVQVRGLSVLGAAHAGVAGLAEGTAGFVGVRPEHVTLADGGEGPSLRCRISSLEYLGSEALIQARAGDGGEEICLRTGIDAFERARLSDWLEVRLSSRDMLLFGSDRRRVAWAAAT